jgi:hypothetical protein
MSVRLLIYKVANKLEWKPRFVSYVVVFLLFTFSLRVSIWISNLPHLTDMEIQLWANEPIIIQTPNQWSKIKLVIYMTTHLTETHILFLPCWHDAIQRMEIFKYADLILYATEVPTPEQLAMLPFRKTTIKLYNNTGYSEGAIQAMVDPFVENVTWFDDYDWVIRLNPDVVIRNDTWLIQTMLNTSIDGIFHDCLNRKSYANSTTDFHTDFYAFRPSAVELERVRNTNQQYAENHMSDAFRNFFDSGRFAYVDGANNSHPGMCRIEGPDSPVIHHHDLWMACPYYYNASKEGIY